MRLRKQKEVQKENEFYMQLLQQALPPEQQMLQKPDKESEEAVKGLPDMDSSILIHHNGGIPANKKLSATLPEIEYREKGKEKDKDAKKHNLGINNNNILQPVDSKIQEIEYMENHINSKRLNNDLVGSTENLLKEDSCTASSKNYKNASGVVNSSPRSHSATNGSIPSSSSKNEKKQKCTSKSPSTHKDLMENCIPNNQLSKPDALVRLEQDIKKLKADLQASRQVEQELRSQISSLSSSERGIRSEMGQLRQENELLQNKLHNAVQMKQKDKQNISQLEKKLKAEQEARSFVEKQLMEEKKRKKLEEATAARAVAFAAASRGECTETLRNRIRELEAEGKKLTMDMKVKEDQIRELELKVQELRKYKENEKDTEVLMSALSAMQDKTQHLENSLSAETRIKLDLFSALGDAKRQLEIAQGQILQKDQEIKDLKQKIAEVMAVMPSITYSAATSPLSSVSPHYSSKFVETSPSGLDPNASVYQPLKKWGPAVCFAQQLGYHAASQRSVSGSQDIKKKVYIVFCGTVYVVIFKKGGKDNIQVWLELPISFSCKFLEDLTETLKFIFLGQYIKTILGFQVANFAFYVFLQFPLEEKKKKKQGFCFSTLYFCFVPK